MPLSWMTIKGRRAHRTWGGNHREKGMWAMNYGHDGYVSLHMSSIGTSPLDGP